MDIVGFFNPYHVTHHASILSQHNVNLFDQPCWLIIMDIVPIWLQACCLKFRPFSLQRSITLIINKYWSNHLSYGAHSCISVLQVPLSGPTAGSVIQREIATLAGQMTLEESLQTRNNMLWMCPLGRWLSRRVAGSVGAQG